MNERLRDAYLRAMQVPNLALRFALPGALPGARRTAPRPTTPRPTPQPRPRPTPRPTPRPRPQPRPRPTPQSTSQPTLDGARTLAFGVYVAESTVLVDSWPAERDWKFATAAAAERELARNLLVALGLLGAPGAVRALEFGWPKADTDCARRQALRFVEENGAGARRLILLGDAAIRHLRDDSPRGVELLYCEVALSEALQRPGRKAELWRELYPHCPVAGRWEQDV